MSDSPEKRADALKDSLNDLQTSWNQAEGLLTQIARANPRLAPDINRVVSAFRRSAQKAQDSVQKSVTELALLKDLIGQSARLTSSLQLDDVLEAVMDTIVELTGAERGYLMLAEGGDRTKMEVRTARNWNRESIKQEDVMVSQSVITMALNNGQPVITDNAQFDERFQGAHSIIAGSFVSILCLPLMLKGETVGVLYADSRFDKGIFDTTMIPLLSVFATQAAIAITNASSFERVKENLEQAKREVQELRIQVDEKKVTRQLKEITESEYFQMLAAMKDEIRNRHEKNKDNTD
jgi:transcriptional regulator with GAF, ATPase, and Fis domain